MAEKEGTQVGSMSFTGLSKWSFKDSTYSLSAMPIKDVGCIVRSLIRDSGQVFHALVFVPGVQLGSDEQGNQILVKFDK